MRKIRRFLSVALLCALLMTFLPPTARADQVVLFPDIPEGASYLDAVLALSEMGIITGDQNGNFNPDSSITRGEAATIICCMLGVEDEAKQIRTCDFADTRNHWSAGYVAKAAELGIISGYDSNTFGPDDPVTYAQMAKLLVCAYGYGDLAIEFGGWPNGYWSIASDLSFFNGLTCEATDNALRKNVVVLLNNYNQLWRPL